MSILWLLRQPCQNLLGCERTAPPNGNWHLLFQWHPNLLWGSQIPGCPPRGTADYIKKFICQRVSEWQATVETLSSIATSQPHAAYSAMTHGLNSQWLFLQRTVPNLAPLLQSLEETISEKFIPALTGRRGCSDLERELFALPARLGGLGLTNPTQSANHQHSASLNITSPLTAAIKNQDCNYSTNIIDQQLKTKQSTHRISRQLKLATANSVKSKLDDNIRRTVTLASEKGASSWLTALPIEQHGFALHKGAFRDALSLRYNWPPSNLPTNCVCILISNISILR